MEGASEGWWSPGDEVPSAPGPSTPLPGAQAASLRSNPSWGLSSGASSSDSLSDAITFHSALEQAGPDWAENGLGGESDEQGAEEGPRPDLINQLPSDLLLLVLSQLDWPTKRGSVHLVCRRWAALCAEPSGMWRRVKLDLSWEGRNGQVRGQALVAWLNRRAAGVHTLCLLRSEPVLTCHAAGAFLGQERFFHDFYPVPVEGMRALMAGLSSLQELAIESCNDLLIGNTYAALSTLTTLTRLELARLRKSILSHPTTFLSCLTRLASLSIKCEDDWHPGWTVLPHFPPEISALCALTHLSITSKGVKEVPAFVSQLGALQDLRLCGCGLSRLPEEVSDLQSLTQLKLNSNPLGLGPSGDPEYEHSLLCLPEQLSVLTSLQRLELMQCKLKCMPEAVLGLVGLQELMLGFNRIDRLPHQASNLRGLSNLRHMSLFSNRLMHVPSAFSSLTALEELFLDDNLHLEFSDPLAWPLALPRLLCLSAVKDVEHIEEVPAHSWSHESLNHLLQLESHLLELRPGRRVLRLCYGHAGGLPLRDRAW